MTTQKACKQCKSIFEGSTCPRCNSKEISDSFKGKIYVIKPEQSEIAQNLKIKEKGTYALKLH